MQQADQPKDDTGNSASTHSSRSPVSVAILAAVACVPLVVAAGFLADRAPDTAAVAAVPGDISVLALRGQLDAPPDKRPSLPMRAGY